MYLLTYVAVNIKTVLL